MPNVMPIAGALAGTTGSPYAVKLATTSAPTGTYNFTNTLFPTIQNYIPGWFLIVPQTGSCSIQITTDNGSSYINLVIGSGTGTMPCGASYVYIDSGSTLRLNIGTGAANVYAYVMGNF